MAVPEAAAVIDQDGCRYIPHVLGLQVGQTLEIKNSDPFLHNVHYIPRINAEKNIGFPNVMTRNETFEAEEVMIKFKCEVHPWMNCYACVVPHPFFDVTAEKGTYELKGVPPGEYVIEAWHEKYGTQTQTITVGDAPTVELNFTFQAEGS